MQEPNMTVGRPSRQWFEHWCLNCGKLIASVSGTRYLGGWIPHDECGYETLFKEATSTGRCEQIATRPLARANRSRDCHTIPQSA